jgi:hypothetical protein
MTERNCAAVRIHMGGVIGKAELAHAG